MGDSISVGYTDNPAWTVPFQFGYRSGLYTRLTNSGMSLQYVGNSLEPWNGASGNPATPTALDLRRIGQDHCQAFSGQGTSYIAANIAAWLVGDRPDIILLMIGINDISNGSTGEPTVAEVNLSNIVQTVVNNSPNTHLIVAQITPYSSYTDAITKYNNYIRNTLVPYFAAQGNFVTTVDQYTNMLVAGTTNIDASLYANGINHPNAVAYGRMEQTWFAGIQALALPPPPPMINLVINGSFETPDYANGTNASHNITNTAGSGWTLTAGVSGAGSGIDHGDPYGSVGSFPAEGAQQAFLQSSGNSTVMRISQTISNLAAGQYYQLSFQAKSRLRYLGANPFKVRMIDGTATNLLFGGNDIVPNTAGYALCISAPFQASNSVMTLEFADHGLGDSFHLSWIDAVAVYALPGINITGRVSNSGQFQVKFNGDANLSYSVIGTTDLFLPLTNWPVMGPALFQGNNSFLYIDTEVTNVPRRFYRMRSP